MSIVNLFCRICGIRFEANPETYAGEACSDTCWETLEEIKRHHFHQRVLRIAELDKCHALDQPLEMLCDSDLVIDRYPITGPAYQYFKGPWPDGVALDFPIVTFVKRGCEPRRVYGLANVISLIKELSQPCFMPTKKFTKTKK